MAIDYGSYAQSYGGRQDLSGLGDAIGKFVQGSQDAQKMKIQNELGKIEDVLSQSFSDAAYTDVSDYDTVFSPKFEKKDDGEGKMVDNFSKPIPTFMNAGDAFRAYEERAKDVLSNSQFRMAENMGLFNPIQFKQQYEQMKQGYMPMIERKLQQYQADKGFSNREMQSFINSNSKMRNFLRNSLDTTSPMYGLTEEYTPSGLLGGATSALMEGNLPIIAGGAAATRAAQAGYARYKGEKNILRTALSKFQKDINPLKVELGRAGRSKWIKSPAGQKALAKTLEKMKGNFKDDFTSTTARKVEKRNIKNARKVLTEAQKGFKKSKGPVKAASNSYNKAFKTYKKLHRNPSLVTKEVFNKTSAGKSLLEKAKNLGAKTDSAKKSLNSATKNLASANKKAITKGAESSMKMLTKYAQIHGRRGLVKLLGTKLPKTTALWMGAKLLAGGAMTGLSGGALTALGVGMNAYTIYQLGMIAKNALKETGLHKKPSRALSPTKVLFGGK